MNRDIRTEIFSLCCDDNIVVKKNKEMARELISKITSEELKHFNDELLICMMMVKNEHSHRTSEHNKKLKKEAKEGKQELTEEEFLSSF